MDNAGGGGERLVYFAREKWIKNTRFQENSSLNTRVQHACILRIFKSGSKNKAPSSHSTFFFPPDLISSSLKKISQNFIYIFISRSLQNSKSRFVLCFYPKIISPHPVHTHTHTHTHGSPSRRANRIAICARQQSLSRSCSSRSKGKRWKLAATNCSRWKVGGGNHGRLNPHWNRPRLSAGMGEEEEEENG